MRLSPLRTFAPLLPLLLVACGGYARMSGAPYSPSAERSYPPAPYASGVVMADGMTSSDASPLTVHVRWKPLVGGDAKESAFVMPKESIATTFAAAPANFRFAAGVMGFAELLRKSPLAKEWTWAQVKSIVKEAEGNAADRAQLLDLIARAEKLSGQQ